MKWEDDFKEYLGKNETIFGTLNKHENKYVSSVPFDSHISVIDLKTNEIKKYYAGSNNAEAPRNSRDLSLISIIINIK